MLIKPLDLHLELFIDDSVRLLMPADRLLQVALLLDFLRYALSLILLE